MNRTETACCSAASSRSISRSPSWSGRGEHLSVRTPGHPDAERKADPSISGARIHEHWRHGGVVDEAAAVGHFGWSTCCRCISPMRAPARRNQLCRPQTACRRIAACSTTSSSSTALHRIVDGHRRSAAGRCSQAGRSCSSCSRVTVGHVMTSDAGYCKDLIASRDGGGTVRRGWRLIEPASRVRHTPGNIAPEELRSCCGSVQQAFSRAMRRRS